MSYKKLTDNLKPITANHTYFEFTGLNVNDVSISRLIQNTTGNDVYITEIRFFHTDSDTDFDYDKWITSTSVQHTIDISSSNNNYPTNSIREFLSCETTSQLMSRYNSEYHARGPFSLNTNFRNIWISVKYEVPILCENNNFVRLFKNGNTSYLTSYKICVIGYY